MGIWMAVTRTEASVMKWEQTFSYLQLHDTWLWMGNYFIANGGFVCFYCMCFYSVAKALCVKGKKEKHSSKELPGVWLEVPRWVPVQRFVSAGGAGAGRSSVLLCVPAPGFGARLGRGGKVCRGWVEPVLQFALEWQYCEKHWAILCFCSAFVTTSRPRLCCFPQG